MFQKGTLLAADTGFQSLTGTDYILDGYVKSGTQGEIYKVKSADGNVYALKVYFPRFAEAPYLYPDIERLVTKWKNPGSEFVWPKEIAVFENTFGYIMNYADLTKMRRIFDDDRIIDRDIACKTCGNIAKAMQKLHLQGLCYKDLSPNNFVYNPRNGQVVIFDCDNINPRGTKSTVMGTPGYRAPEIVLGKKYPDDFSDIFSMATIFFKIWMGSDISPLEGAVFYKEFFGILSTGGENGNAERYLYGTNPVFIFDEENFSNSFDDSDEFQFGKKVLWQYFVPGSLKELFYKTFTRGLHSPSLRPADGIWADCFADILKNVVKCKECGAKNISTLPYCIDCHEKLV